MKRTHSALTLALVFACGVEHEDPEAYAEKGSKLSNSYVTTYSTWSSSGGGLWNIDARIRILKDPGTSVPYFYARHGNWTNNSGDDGWYIGLQTDGSGPRTKTAIFSIWNARDAEAVTSDAECVNFGNEGSGKSCRLAYNWRAGRTYRLRVWRQNDGWWLASVYDETSRQSRTIGRIRARANQGDLRRGITDFVEYYGGNFPSCSTLRPSRARFYRPTGNNGALNLSPTGASTGGGACDYWRDSVQHTTYADHLMGMAGPFFVRTILPGGRCLDAGGGAQGAYAYMRSCSASNGNLRWFRESSGGLSADVSGYRCLDANTGAFGRQVYMRTCSASNTNLLWDFVGIGGGNYHVKTRLPGRRCLDANTGAHGRRAYMRDCDGGQNANLAWKLQRL